MKSSEAFTIWAQQTVNKPAVAAAQTDDMKPTQPLRRKAKITGQTKPGYSLLLQFMAKEERNKLDELVNRVINDQNDEIQAVLEKMQLGKEHLIDFKRPDIDLILLAILKRSESGSIEISYTQWVSTYTMYLYTTQFQPGAEALSDIYKVHPLLDEQQALTGWGKVYCVKLLENLKKWRVETTEAELHSLLQTVSVAECTINEALILRDQPGAVELIRGADAVNPFSFITEICIINPSTGVYQALVQKYDPNLRVAAIFGVVNEETIRESRDNDLVLLAAHSIRTSRNYVEVHNSLAGPFPTISHDKAHGAMLAMFPRLERRFIFDELLPCLDIVSAQLMSTDDTSTALKQQIKKSQNALADVDLGSIYLPRSFDDMSTAGSESLNIFTEFCIKSVLPNLNYRSGGFFSKESMTKEDLLYYMIVKNLLPRKDEILTKYGVDITQIAFGSCAQMSVELTSAFIKLIEAETLTVKSEDEACESVASALQKLQEQSELTQEEYSELVSKFEDSDNMADLWQWFCESHNGRKLCFALWSVDLAFFPPGNVEKAQEVFEGIKATLSHETPQPMTAQLS